MNDVDGLAAAAAFYVVTCVLLVIAALITRELIRRPAAMLAIVTGAMGSLLMVRHAPAGPVWEPPQWSAEHGVRNSVRMGLGLRDGGMPEGVKGSMRRSGGLAPGSASARGSDADEAGAGAPAGGGEVGTGGRSGLLAFLWTAPPRQASPQDIVRDCADCPELVIVPAGAAVIGAAADDRQASEAERPATEVRFWPGFAIGRGEVTVAQYARFMAATGRPAPVCSGAQSGAPAGMGVGIGNVLPVSCVSWNDAAAYAAWLRRTTGKAYRLPSAAEWEYAALAGRPAGASARQDNAWGLLAMGGSLAEHVADCWRAELSASVDTGIDAGCPRRMVKDGADGEASRWQRHSARRPLEPTVVQPTTGFRVARDLR